MCMYVCVCVCILVKFCSRTLVNTGHGMVGEYA